MSTCLISSPALAHAAGPEDIAAARRLFLSYIRWLAIDLSYQNVDEELATLPGAYAPPAGRLLLARVAGETVGCVALRPLEPGICEMKRLWVEPGFAGHGIGRALAERIVAEARAIGYRRMRLDTLPERMPAAQHLYRALGFVEIPPYYHNPVRTWSCWSCRSRPETRRRRPSDGARSSGTASRMVKIAHRG